MTMTDRPFTARAKLQKACPALPCSAVSVMISGRGGREEEQSRPGVARLQPSCSQPLHFHGDNCWGQILVQQSCVCFIWQDVEMRELREYLGFFLSAVIPFKGTAATLGLPEFYYCINYMNIYRIYGDDSQRNTVLQNLSYLDNTRSYQCVAPFLIWPTETTWKQVTKLRYQVNSEPPLPEFPHNWVRGAAHLPVFAHQPEPFMSRDGGRSYVAHLLEPKMTRPYLVAFKIPKLYKISHHIECFNAYMKY